MKAQPTTKQLIEMLYERLPELFDRSAAQPAPVPMAHIVGEIDHNGKVWKSVQNIEHCEAGPEFCPVCRAETRSLALAAAVGYIQRNTPTLVWTEICNALTTTPPAQPATEESSATQPAVPDAFGTREGEHPEYIQGWNDCRAEMLKGMKP